MTVVDEERRYWENRLGPDIPLHAVGYLGLSNAFVSWLYRLRTRRFLGMARKVALANSRVLDIGSGGGFFVDLWQRLGVARVTASDITQTSVNALRRRFTGIEAVQMDFGSDSIPLRPESFDAISVIDVFHHIVDDEHYERAIRNCAMLLKPGGTLIFTENFLHGPAFRAPHMTSRPLDQIEKILHDSGLEPIERRPIFVLMNNPVDSTSRIHALFWKVVSAASENPVAGYIIGMLLYPIEVVLTSILPEGPSTEMMACRKVPA